MSFRLKFTLEAKADLERLYAFIVDNDPGAAQRALATISKAWTVLEEFPFSCRKAEATNPFLRELVISFGNAGYVALFEIEDRSNRGDAIVGTVYPSPAIVGTVYPSPKYAYR